MGRARSVLVASLITTRVTLQRVVDVLRYLTMNVMRRAELEDSIVATWTGWAPESDESATLFPWETDVYDRVLERTDRILVIGCGSGRDVIALLELGYRAEGIELVPASAEIARARLTERGLRVPVVTGNIRTTPLTGAYDVFIFSWFCYCYIPEAATRIGILRKLSAHLAPGGRIVISYIPDPVGVHPRAIRLARSVGWLTRSDWRAEAGDIFIETGGGTLAYQHHFTAGDIEAEARTAGFRVLYHHHNPDRPTVVLTH